MSDIEDEVKCSECPNARHGFDRDASHNEGRYVCQCESHKCPAESLRQQLAEKDADIERLKSPLQRIVSYYNLVNSGSSLPSMNTQAKAEHENTMFGEARKALNYGR